MLDFYEKHVNVADRCCADEDVNLEKINDVLYNKLEGLHLFPLINAQDGGPSAVLHFANGNLWWIHSHLLDPSLVININCFLFLFQGLLRKANQWWIKFRWVCSRWPAHGMFQHDAHFFKMSFQKYLHEEKVRFKSKMCLYGQNIFFSFFCGSVAIILPVAIV